MRFANNNSLRQIEEYGEEIITVYCTKCNEEVGDFFENDYFPELCEACDPDYKVIIQPIEYTDLKWHHYSA